MTRRKSVCLKWTLVLLVVIVCPSVYTRPQEAPATISISGQNEQPTQAPLRYKYRHNNLSLSSFKLSPIVISTVNNRNKIDNTLFNISDQISLINTTAKESDKNNRNISLSRLGRLIRSNSHEAKKKFRPKLVKNKHHEEVSLQDRKKPAIRKVITKWRDKTKYDDLNFSYESTTMAEQTKDVTKISGSHSNDVTSTESSEEANSKRYSRPPNNMHYNGAPNDMHYNMYNKPRPQYSEETHVYSTNIQVMQPNPNPNMQVIDQYPHPTRPPYMHTYVPTPTPVITNVGYPQPWTQTVRKTTTPRPRPTKYEYHNNVNNYGGNYEVTTFEPSNSYTDRIVIRPEEYSPSSEDCPTIYLTLNNTFQGQGKEACPDLNIAVNTNVINKNVVVESEEDGGSLFPGFGLGLGDDGGLNIGDDSGTDSSKDEDYFESDENDDQADSASVEGTELVNYHSVNSPIQSESGEASSYGAANSPVSAITKPGRPGSDDDIFSFSSLVDFFRPALNALGWLTTVNPLSIGLFPLLLAPLGLLFAGSGFAALFAPWFLPIGREAPKVIHVYRPEWRWDQHLKTWQLHSFPNNRRVVPEMGRTSNEMREEGKAMPTLFSRLKNWMIDVTNKLNKRANNYTVTRERKSKRRKREIWALRVK